MKNAIGQESVQGKGQLKSPRPAPPKPQPATPKTAGGSTSHDPAEHEEDPENPERRSMSTSVMERASMGLLAKLLETGNLAPCAELLLELDGEGFHFTSFSSGTIYLSDGQDVVAIINRLAGSSRVAFQHKRDGMGIGSESVTVGNPPVEADHAAWRNQLERVRRLTTELNDLIEEDKQAEVAS